MRTSIKVDILVKHYWSIFFIATGIGFFLMSYTIFTQKPLQALLFILLGIVLTTTHHRLLIYPDQNIYKEYIWFLGFKYGFNSSFERMEYLFIIATRQSQVYSQPHKNHYVIGTQFKAFLKFSDGSKVLVGDNSSKSTIQKRLTKINRLLELEIIDYS